MNNNVDLTLKLGLPDGAHAHHNNHVFYVNNTAPLPNPTFAGPNIQGMDQSGIVNQGAMFQAQQSFDGRHCAWPSQSGNHTASNAQNMSYPNAFNQFCGASMGSSCYANNFFPAHQLPPSPILGSAPPMNHYTLLDVPPRRAAIEVGGPSASGSGGRRSYRRLRGDAVGIYNDPNKRCTNYNCNTNDTPMWRKGPLGPKTLCNACGIKYRKEEEKKRAKEA